MKCVRLAIVFLFVAYLAIFGQVGCSWLRQDLSSSDKEAPSGKGMVCVYRIDSPDEYGAECKIKLSMNKKVVCTLAPGEYWSSDSCESGQVNISASVNFDSIKERKGSAYVEMSHGVEANQTLYMRVIVPRQQGEEAERPRGPMTGTIEEIKDCTRDGKKFAPPHQVPEGSSLVFIYRLSSPNERGPEYPSEIYVNQKRIGTLRPGEYCADVSEASWIAITTTLNRQPTINDGIPTIVAEDGSSCSVDGSPNIGFCFPGKPSEVHYIRVIYPKELVAAPAPLQIEIGKQGEMTGCRPVKR